MNVHAGRALERHEIVELLTEARSRTLLLVAALSEEELGTQHDPLMSPIIWDLGHIGHFEEVWLVEKLRDGGGEGEGLRGMYNPFENPRSSRKDLDLPSLYECLAYMRRVRRAALDQLGSGVAGAGEPLLRDGFVFRMVLQHEYQHNETILQTLQLKKGRPFPAPRLLPLPETRGGPGPHGGMVRFPGGTVVVGTDDRSAAYDNERPRHQVELPSFWIDATPVTNGAYLEFMADGGYRDARHWTEEGWAWRREEDVRAPKYWSERDGRWWTRIMDLERPVDPERPVCHVCHHEAEAYAHWAGKRLPTEFEWEAAATWDPESGASSAFPWGGQPSGPGVANLDALTFDTAPVWSYADNVSPVGCYGMIGDVWEWTSTDFHGYPGYQTFPYKEYSEAFFGTDFKVLRGGSWATRSGAIRSTFRNWDYPIRRQIFSGFRCARDA